MERVIRFGRRKVMRFGRGYCITLPVELARTMRDEGVEEVEVMWVDGCVVLVPVEVEVEVGVGADEEEDVRVEEERPLHEAGDFEEL